MRTPLTRAMVDAQRIRTRNEAPRRGGAVLYWMQREQRANDNWALLHAQELAIENAAPLYVLFNLVQTYSYATERHYGFMVRGLHEVAETLRTHNIGFTITRGDPATVITRFVSAHDIGAVVTDFNPLRIVEEWKRALAAALPVSLIEVDAHNIVPCWVASDKEEFAAHTFRPKIHRALGAFSGALPALQTHAHTPQNLPMVAWETLGVDASVETATSIAPGERAAAVQCADFLQRMSGSYAELRNDPTKHVLSGLSPYLHFGQISAQRVAHEVERGGIALADREAFLEELIVRRELSDNYCFYQPHYDSIDGAREWARETLAAHVDDPREYTYTYEEFRDAKTHDPLWNAAQTEMVKCGTMHGYMRMYWAKKILEWTNSPMRAIEIAIQLNDTFSLDGRDPNGYAGIMWSIAGVHDRGWPERPIYGTIRYMNYNGAKRKFDVNEYIAHVNAIEST